MTVDLPGLDVEHLHGPEEIPYGKEDLLVVCLVRDGRPWMESFIEHYSALGVKHVVFLDNGSSDGTVPAARRYDNVTVLRTKLPFKHYELLLRQYLIARFGKDRWSLCVDIDELFDYPYSDVIGLGSLLGYLNSNSYTAVTAQMLDMFPEKPLSDGEGEPEGLRKDLHRFYDVSKLRRKNIEEHSGRNNMFESDEIECLAGGIRETIFGVVPRLTKFPLVFSGGGVRPMEGSPHHIDNARVADFSCVLFHYKFLGHFREQASQAAREENHWSDSAQYKKYLEVLDRNPTLQVKQETSKEVTSVNDLLEEGFLVLSADYVSWVNAEEETSVLQEPQSEPHGLVEAFLESRRRERKRALRIQRLERQLRDRGRRIRRLKQNQQHLMQRIRSLEAQI
jgi:Glycosyl transferase family 2